MIEMETLNNKFIQAYKGSNDTLEAFFIHMFQKGVEISDLLEKMYGHHY